VFDGLGLPMSILLSVPPRVFIMRGPFGRAMAERSPGARGPREDSGAPRAQGRVDELASSSVRCRSGSTLQTNSCAAGRTRRHVAQTRGRVMNPDDIIVSSQSPACLVRNAVPPGDFASGKALAARITGKKGVATDDEPQKK